MSYVVLARKWRPKKFEDVVGQEHIVASLKHALETGQVGHAYLFSGTRGIGKTSMARLFAKSLRCEARLPDQNPCGQCSSCLDSEDDSSLNIIEIDGASNNKVEDVRELIENVRFLPTSGQYKVYIIDEVHMLSTSAFNALLKTLEEPPAHVVFLLATTEPKKLLGTVLSRCQRFDFRNASLKSLQKHVEKIAATEGIKFESPDLVAQICNAGQGSIRDTLSLLDQVVSLSAGEMITAETTALALGTANQKVVDHLLTLIFSGQSKAAMTVMDEIYSLNVSAESLASTLMDRLFEVVQSLDTTQDNIGAELKSASNDLGAQELIWMYETLAKDLSFILDLGFADKALAVAVLKVTKRRDFFTATAEKKKTEPQVSAPKAEVQAPIEEPISQQVSIEAEPVPEPEAAPEPAPTEKEATVVAKKAMTFEGFLSFLKSTQLAMASNLEQGNLISPFVYKENSVVMHLGYAKQSELFFDHLNDQESKKNLIAAIENYFEVSRDEIELSIELIEQEESFSSMADEQAKEKALADEQKRESILQNPLIKEAESIFNTKVDKVVLNEEK